MQVFAFIFLLYILNNFMISSLLAVLRAYVVWALCPSDKISTVYLQLNEMSAPGSQHFHNSIYSLFQTCHSSSSGQFPGQVEKFFLLFLCLLLIIYILTIPRLPLAIFSVSLTILFLLRYISYVFISCLSYWKLLSPLSICCIWLRSLPLVFATYPVYLLL